MARQFWRRAVYAFCMLATLKPLKYLRGNLVDPRLRSLRDLRLAWPTHHAGLAALAHERHELLELMVVRVMVVGGGAQFI